MAVRVTVALKILHNNGHAVKAWTPIKTEWIGYGAFPEHERPRVAAAREGDELAVDVPYWLARRLELVE